MQLVCWAVGHDNPNSDIPAISNNTANQEQRFSSWFIEDGSYIKLRNIELGYTFPTKLIKKMHMSNLRLYAAAYNVFTLKKFWEMTNIQVSIQKDLLIII